MIFREFVNQTVPHDFLQYLHLLISVKNLLVDQKSIVKILKSSFWPKNGGKN